ncbi:anhydro-N-acetylmuramic acid kinase [Herbaspirillum sp. RTI4]|uniref:anhydro-N-acetylmuramic acid kinase n=1 Tax=Herbaspirillum sp. RTI4 TaxID=3048640 RepID=UPI002AB50C72|nr:anhydro-N-acetylmuramic acid kinase [Herbaspirillum sp. RTI4]MDY7577539.1 anhydro-N-acetylmuramic acid kinase [Herbaspirillum sp. RTI4]MEA9981014.1 anhydro-N-acetylmuramic acid kinase [Herbaspirillum sp. RTI4]
MAAPSRNLYIGLMSGTSLDGVDGVLASFSDNDTAPTLLTLADAYVEFPSALRASLMALQVSGTDEIDREALAANELVRHYAACVEQLLLQSGCAAADISAIGAHGQTIRHQPHRGYTRQTNNPALLAELCGIDVIADFRSRDVAAGGQGAPLVPAFHRAVFGSQDAARVTVNIGGIANISILPAEAAAHTAGFDTGPGNVLMDGWILRHQGHAYDADGAWAGSGTVRQDVLKVLRQEDFFALPPPKSTGRDLFHMAWLDARLACCPTYPAADIQATLTALTASTIAEAMQRHAPDARQLYVCGGGAYNGVLMQALRTRLSSPGQEVTVASTAVLGVAPNQVEALAFAWLAQRFSVRQPGNLPAVTGAVGLRVLGALYPA